MQLVITTMQILAFLEILKSEMRIVSRHSESQKLAHFFYLTQIFLLKKSALISLDIVIALLYS